ncbi:MAG: hypothetical protein IT307_15775 [Chloroflexi bacterium]|nr:hypothetical protein [Chloroflexota bacterium]
MEHVPAHALDYLSMIRRRRWWFAIPLLLAIGAGAALLRILPKEYESTTTIGVTGATVAPNLIHQSALLNNEERTRALSQQLLSRDILARVVEEEGLRSGGATDADISRLKGAIRLRVAEPVAGTSERRLDAFILSYTDRDPARAQRVANRLVNVFVEENSRVRTTLAESTSAFLAAEVQAKQTQLAEMEARLRQSKENFLGSLPSQMEANLETLAGLRRQLETNATALRSQQDRLTMIEQQISAVEEGSAESQAGAFEATPESRVFDLEAALAEARRAYTDKHPEVIRLQNSLEAAREAAAAGRMQPPANRHAQLLRNPSYRQLTSDRDQTRLAINELRLSDVAVRRQIGEYQARVEAAPRIEQQLASVQREYDRAQAQYHDLAGKLDAARTAENVARNGDGEQFAVLYAATLPGTPVKPIPWRVMLIAVMAGLCLGGGAALGREYLDRSVHSARDVIDEFDLPVLGEVAHIRAS